MWVKTESENYSNIADAIREMNRVSTKYTPAQMPEKIQNLLVANQIVAPQDNHVSQTCDNSSGSKSKDFTVSLSLWYQTEYAKLFIYHAEAYNGSTLTGSAAALIRRSSHVKISETVSGEMKTGTASGAGIQFTYNAKITVPAGETRTVNITGYALRYR